MNKELMGLRLELLASLVKLGHSGQEDKLFSLEFPDEPDLRKIKLITVVNYLEEQFRDPKDFLEKALKDKSDDVKKTALKLIRELNDDRFIKNILPLLESKKEDMVHMACKTIRSLRSEEKNFLKPLTDVIINKKKSLHTRIWAIKSLKYDNDSTLILDTLMSVLNDENPDIRIEATKVIDCLLDCDLVLTTILEKLYSDHDTEIELSLVRAISGIKSPKTAEYLKPYLEHEDIRFQEVAVYGLGNSGDENSIEDLIKKLEYIEKNFNFES